MAPLPTSLETVSNPIIKIKPALFVGNHPCNHRFSSRYFRGREDNACGSLWRGSRENLMYSVFLNLQLFLEAKFTTNLECWTLPFTMDSTLGHGKDDRVQNPWGWEWSCVYLCSVPTRIPDSPQPSVSIHNWPQWPRKGPLPKPARSRPVTT